MQAPADPQPLARRLKSSAEATEFVAASPACGVVAAEFDAAFYATQMGPVRGRASSRPKDAQWLVDYLTIGWREHKNPSPSFCVRRYLSANPDVEAQGIEPFYHYLAHGRHEGRKAFQVERATDEVAADAPLDDPVDSLPYELERATDEVAADAPLDDPVDSLAYERRVVLPFFDAAFYARTYPDAAAVGLDPLTHYLTHGWREGRDPSPEFSTEYYLSANPDVRDAAIIPLVHYAAAGYDEGRPTRDPGGWKAKLLSGLTNLETRAQSWRKRAPLETLSADLFGQRVDQALSAKGSLKAVVALVHDRYYVNTGGIQACVSEEQVFLNRHGYAYIAINPYHPSPTLSSEDISCWLCEVSVDGLLLGVVTGTTALDVLRVRLEGISSHLCVHSLLGHNPSWAEQLASALAFESHHFWLHDYFSLCEGFNLLRNDVAFCGAPAVSSNSCRVCVYGAGRERHLLRISSLFSKVPFTVVAPSESAMQLWRLRTGLQHKSAVVVAHRTLQRRKPVGRAARSKGPARIAFLGHPAAHKGWFIFKELVNALRHDPRYEFLHLGLSPDTDLSVQHVPVKYSTSHPKAMQEAVERYRIDVALILSTWPETFCLTAYEALAGGSLLYALEPSGNVATVIGDTGKGKVFASLDDLINDFRTSETESLVVRHRQRGARHGDLVGSGVTSKLILAADKKRRATPTGRARKE